MSSACADARSAERSSGLPQGAARAARDVRRPPRVGPCRARVLGARRTDVVSPPRPSCARPPSDPATTRPIYSRCGPRTAGGTTSPAPSSSAPPAQREPRGSPGLNRSSERTTIAGVLPRGPRGVDPARSLAGRYGRAGLRSTMTCVVWRAGSDAGWIQVSFRALSIWCSPSVCFRCSARLRWTCTPTLRLGGRRLSRKGGGRAWARARQWEGISSDAAGAGQATRLGGRCRPVGACRAELSRRGSR
jgi:hypothetical protein